MIKTRQLKQILDAKDAPVVFSGMHFANQIKTLRGIGKY